LWDKRTGRLKDTEEVKRFKRLHIYKVLLGWWNEKKQGWWVHLLKKKLQKITIKLFASNAAM
jgi:hypothetical protein